MNLNKVLLAGRLTRDPELRYTPKGTAVAKLGLGVNRKYKSDSGEQKEEMAFIDIDAWGRQAETISQYCKKGSPLFIEGRLKLDSWDDKESGQKRTKLCVTLESFQFIGSKQDAPTPATRTTAASATSAPPSDDSDMPPF